MPRKKSDLSRLSRTARKSKLIRMRANPKVKVQKINKIAEATKLQRSEETPQQNASRLKAYTIKTHKYRYNMKNSKKLTQQEKDEITQIKDAEKHLAYGEKKFAELKKKLSKLRCKTDIYYDSSNDNAKAGIDLCVVKIECGE